MNRKKVTLTHSNIKSFFSHEVGSNSAKMEIEIMDKRHDLMLTMDTRFRRNDDPYVTLGMEEL